mmetsp:Transcript_58142/g.90450  ORF Transcript_58142/g.90450 Transcript_58142/m.90450 type:complete len:109 (-) Transcript_58142:52-378(-)
MENGKDEETTSDDGDGFQIFEKEALPQAAEGPRKTTPYMTKYERARIIGTRALQLAMNAPVLVELNDEKDALVIAELELDARVLPFVVRRFFPDGTYEDWRLKELLDM